MSSKRKAAQTLAAAPGDTSNNQSAKRRKVSSETPEATTETGLKCLERLRAARDKKDWLITTHFEHLPDQAEFPQYYQQIGLPMALDIIEAKLKSHAYPIMTTVESDLRRMISNAKSFNEKSSQVFSDAEKIRKAVSNFMIENNPAYSTKDYKPFPTPVPEDWQPPPQPSAQGKSEEPEDETKAEADDSTRAVNTRRASSAATGLSNAGENETLAANAPGGLGEPFDSDTFQIAQEKIVAEMLELKNDDDELVVAPFINLPSRNMREYYQIIKHPVSLKIIQRAVQGVRGRDKPTGNSNFKSWATFEEETSCIWKNAYHYNEDGSNIFEAARLLEEYFYRRLAEARKVVSEPPPPKVKLRMPAKTPEPPKLTLKFGSTKPTAASGVSVDGEALRRQQDLVNAGMNGQAPVRAGTRDPTGGPQILPAANGVNSLPRRSEESTSKSSAERPLVNGVKTETSVGRSPALAAVQLSANRSGSLDARQSPAPSLMPPPSIALAPRPPSGSPHPHSYVANHYGSSGYSSASQYESSRRQSGKEALIANLSISTHPGLKIDKHFHLDIPPSPTTTQQSITITLPSSHYFLQIVPTLAASVVHRPFKTFVTVNNSRIPITPQRPDDSNVRKPLYESRVQPGMNRIDIEMVAGTSRGAPKIGTGPELEIEKITIFAHMVKT
ncbi:MAG: hypothetical protein Q9169_007270 [Polycauliona sp. 2 TL-2023]